MESGQKPSPISLLEVYLGWEDDQVDRASEIFSTYSHMLQHDENPDETSFEMRLRDDFDIGYQSVKEIVRRFYQDDRFTDVCKWYASKHDVSEFRVIRRNS